MIPITALLRFKRLQTIRDEYVVDKFNATLYLNKQKGTELFKVNLFEITSIILLLKSKPKMHVTTIGYNQFYVVILAKFFWQLIFAI